ncbi:MAG: DsbA family protein, partial [Anaerolineae bacterium]|nr:DsbA family protein [Anaerolineae bacterium]
MKRRSILFVLTLILVTALTSLTATAQEATPEATEAAAPVTLTDVFASLPQTRLPDGGFVVGEPDAPITIVEFLDYACPHCQDYRPVIDQVIMDYVAAGAAKYEVRIFPTAGGPVTYLVGQFLECAEEQRAGTFWDAYELLY